METFESKSLERSAFSPSTNRTWILCGFYCHQEELIVEVDGGIHEMQRDYDADREEYLIGLGFRVIRFTNDDVMKDLKVVLQKIVAACKRT